MKNAGDLRASALWFGRWHSLESEHHPQSELAALVHGCFQHGQAMDRRQFIEEEPRGAEVGPLPLRHQPADQHIVVWENEVGRAYLRLAFAISAEEQCVRTVEGGRRNVCLVTTSTERRPPGLHLRGYFTCGVLTGRASPFRARPLGFSFLLAFRSGLIPIPVGFGNGLFYLFFSKRSGSFRARASARTWLSTCLPFT